MCLIPRPGHAALHLASAEMRPSSCEPSERQNIRSTWRNIYGRTSLSTRWRVALPHPSLRDKGKPWLQEHPILHAGVRGQRLGKSLVLAQHPLDERESSVRLCEMHPVQKGTWTAVGARHKARRSRSNGTAEEPSTTSRSGTLGKVSSLVAVTGGCKPERPGKTGYLVQRGKQASSNKALGTSE
jgi:hypothetical protein